MYTRTSLRFCLLFFLLSVSFHVSYAQYSHHKKNFDSSYYHVATELAATDIERAIASAELLFKDAADSLQKIKCFMLLATLKERTGKHAEALENAIKGEELAEKAGNTQWQIRIAGFLSTTFREVGLIAEGKKYMAIADKINRNSMGSPLFNVYLHQEKAYYEIEDKAYGRALQQIDSAIILLGYVRQNKANPIINATCYQLAGFCYLQLDSLQQAALYLAKALNTLSNTETELKGFIYQNLGDLALQQKQPGQAKDYLDSALHYSNSSKNLNLQLKTYRSLQEYYTGLHKSDSAVKYQSMYTKLFESNAAFSSSISNDLLEKLGTELEKKDSRNETLYLVCGLLLVLIALILLYFIYSRRQERKKYLAYVARLKDQKAELQERSFSATTAAPGMIPERKPGLTVPAETAERVLADLHSLEKEGYYLKSDVNLSYLSALLKVNSKYLSAIINQYKGKDFNNYINELRVNYIIEKLQNDPQYLDYKIAYLSQECGFSTHSKFTSAFKAITGIAPSAFINNTKNDKRKL